MASRSYFPHKGLAASRGGETASTSVIGSVAQWRGPDLEVGVWGLTLLLPSSAGCVLSGEPSASLPRKQTWR